VPLPVRAETLPFTTVKSPVESPTTLSEKATLSTIGLALVGFGNDVERETLGAATS
jgi:hypothetical protein